MSWSGRLIDYLGQGTAAARPASLTLAPGATGFYFAYDTVAVSVWNSNTSAWDAVAGGGGSGTVTSVALTTPSWLTVSGSPVTTSGTLAVSATTGQTANQFLATPNGSTGAVGLRAVVAADLPSDVAYTDAANVYTRQQAVTPYRANISGAVSIDLAATAKSNNLHLTLTGNVSSFALTNPVDGAVYNIRFIQDSTGSRTITLPSAFKFAGGTAPTFSTAANAVDFMSAEYGSTEGTYMASFLKGMA